MFMVMWWLFLLAVFIGLVSYLPRVAAALFVVVAVILFFAYAPTLALYGLSLILHAATN